MAYFISLGISILIGFVTGLIAILAFKRYHIGFWAFLAGVASDWPRIFLTPLGTTNIDNLLWLTHTIGIFIFPVILVIFDILLIEIGLVKHLRPFYNFLPKQLKSAIKAEKFVGRLQKYMLLPTPEKIQLVYLTGVMAGLIHLLINFFIGSL